MRRATKSGVRRLKKMTCVYFVTLLSIRKAWQRAAADVALGLSAAARDGRPPRGLVLVVRQGSLWVRSSGGFRGGAQGIGSENFGVRRVFARFATRDTSSREDVECRTTIKPAKVEVG